MFKGILSIMTVFLSVSICLPAWPGEPGEPQPAADSAFDTQGERIGGLRQVVGGKRASLISSKPVCN